MFPLQENVTLSVPSLTMFPKKSYPQVFLLQNELPIKMLKCKCILEEIYGNSEFWLEFHKDKRVSGLFSQAL